MSLINNQNRTEHFSTRLIILKKIPYMKVDYSNRIGQWIEGEFVRDLTPEENVKFENEKNER